MTQVRCVLLAAFCAVLLVCPYAGAQTAHESPFVAQAKSVLQQCQSMRISGQVRGYVGSIKCSNPGLAQLAQTYRVADGDIVALYLAQRLEIAERMDAGRLTEGQGLVEMAKAYQEAAQMQLARRQGAAAVIAQRNAQAQAAAEDSRQARSNAAACASRALAQSGALDYYVPFQGARIPGTVSALAAMAGASCN